jgi:hypothetical protein
VVGAADGRGLPRPALDVGVGSASEQPTRERRQLHRRSEPTAP